MLDGKRCENFNQTLMLQIKLNITLLGGVPVPHELPHEIKNLSKGLYWCVINRLPKTGLMNIHSD